MWALLIIGKLSILCLLVLLLLFYFGGGENTNAGVDSVNFHDKTDNELSLYIHLC